MALVPAGRPIGTNMLKISIVLTIVLVAVVYTTKLKFRSKTGCCVCGTKSQSGKPFLKSDSYKDKFPDVFGLEERNGDICSACIKSCTTAEDRRSSEKRGKSFQVLKIYEIIRIRNSILVYLLLVSILLCALPFTFFKNKCSITIFRLF